MSTAERQAAIVTGASRGIGAAIARRLGRDGLAIVVNYVNSAAEAEALVAEIVGAGGTAVAARGDVADMAAARGLFDAAIAAYGRVDVLINNAGVMPSRMPVVAETDEAIFDRLMAINLKGSFNMLREAATRLQSGGRIVNFSSSLVGTLLPGYAAYAGTKAAIEAITKVMAKEMRGRRITVNAVAPGPTATALFLDGKTPELIDRLAKASPLERLGTPEDIAAAVAFLVGPDGGWINGQVLRANGGMV